MAAVEPRGAGAAAPSSRRPAIVFVGFMGAGKTSAAEAARAAGLEAIEADELLEGELGMPIAAFFGRRGEAEFRSLEEAEVGQLLEDADGGVIALGGGAVCSERVRKALRRHVVVWLQVSAEEAWRRVEGGDRPLAQDRGRFEALHAEREPIYEAVADAILPAGDERLAARALPAIRGLREMPPGTRMAWASSASGEYPAFVGERILDAGYWPLDGRRFCVTDTTVSNWRRSLGVERYNAGTVKLRRASYDDPERSRKMRAAKFGKRRAPHTAESKEKIRAALKRFYGK